jgi:DNA-binding transcriptional LysR family regulator
LLLKSEFRRWEPLLAGLDANLLVALDALLTERGVTRAAQRLHTSPAAMSRTLARNRRVLGDPVLVRAGQSMVLTPRALAMREEVGAVVERCRRLLVPAEDVDLATLTHTFTVQTSDLLLAALASGLHEAAAAQAPGVSVRFLSEAVEDTDALRDGVVDVEVGVLDHLDPETRTEDLVPLRMYAAVRAGHPLTRGELTPARFSAAEHISVSRRGLAYGPVDTALAELGLRRRVPVVLPTHTAALLLARDTDLVCLTAAALPGDAASTLGLPTLEVPLQLPPRTIGMAWHPRNDADPGQRWLRDQVRRVLTDQR